MTSKRKLMSPEDTEIVDLKKIKQELKSLNMSGKPKNESTDQHEEFKTPVFAMPELLNN